MILVIVSEREGCTVFEQGGWDWVKFALFVLRGSNEGSDLCFSSRVKQGNRCSRWKSCFAVVAWGSGRLV